MNYEIYIEESSLVRVLSNVIDEIIILTIRGDT